MNHHFSILLLVAITLQEAESMITDKPTVTIPRDSYNTTEGTSFTIPCSVSSATNVTVVSWERIINGQNSSEIDIDGVDFCGATTEDPSLTINTPSTEDSGIYTCFATNDVGSGGSSTQLTVSGSNPTVTIPLASYNTIEESSFTIPCSISSTTNVHYIQWQRIINGQGPFDVNINGVEYTGATKQDPSLTINPTATEDSGEYHCIVVYEGGSGYDQTQLTVSGYKPTVTIPRASYNTTEGTSFTIPCSVTSTTNVTYVYWERIINCQKSSRIIIDLVDFSGATTEDPSLTISTTSTEDSGTYTCFATNAFGTGDSPTQLTVSGSVPTVSITITEEITVTAPHSTSSMMVTGVWPCIFLLLLQWCM